MHGRIGDGDIASIARLIDGYMGAQANGVDRCHRDTDGTGEETISAKGSENDGTLGRSSNLASRKGKDQATSHLTGSRR